MAHEGRLDRGELWPAPGLDPSDPGDRPAGPGPPGGLQPERADGVLEVLQARHWSVVLDLSALKPERSKAYLEAVAAGVESIRARHGLPHWILVDEAQGPLGEFGAVTELHRPSEAGYCYVTYRPEVLCSAGCATVDLTLTALGADRSMPEGRSVALYRATGQAETSFQVDPRATEHVRHRHKYLTIPLPAHHQFVFTDETGQPIDTAASRAIRRIARIPVMGTAVPGTLLAASWCSPSSTT